jgi:hypothetical protein
MDKNKLREIWLKSNDPDKYKDVIEFRDLHSIEYNKFSQLLT